MADTPNPSSRSNKEEGSLGLRWRLFGRVLFDPIVVSLLTATGILIFLSVDVANADVGEQQPAAALTTLISLITAVLASVAGAVIHQRLAEQSDSSKLVTRGKSAIRGLKILLLNLGSLENRTKVFLDRACTGDSPQDPVRIANLEEVIGRMNSMQEEALNAIEEWQDIIPEANIATQIVLLSDLKEEGASLSAQVESLRSELSSTKSENAVNEDVANDMKRRLLVKERELSRVSTELREKERELRSSVLSGLSGSSASWLTSIDPRSSQATLAVCPDCQNVYDPSSSKSGACPRCDENTGTRRVRRRS